MKQVPDSVPGLVACSQFWYDLNFFVRDRQLTLLQALSTDADEEDKHEDDEDEEEDDNDEPRGAGTLQTSRGWFPRRGDLPGGTGRRNGAAIGRHHAHLVRCR